MDSKKPAIASIDEYIASFPDDVQARLQELRATIKAAAPDATEKISYGMAVFDLKGYLVYFAAHKNHIGFYPAPRGIEAFKDELDAYAGSKGTVQFPFDRPLPHDLIRRIVQFRVEENLQKAAAKAQKKKP
jgi:uncharacterized protein YdhG (YjbR/CyaY superfamily)